MLKNSNSFSQNLVRSPLDASSSGFCTFVDSRPQGGKKASEGGRLGTYTESVVTPVHDNARFNSRRRLFSLKKTASSLVWVGIRKDHRIVKCKWTKCAEKVGLYLNTYGEGKDEVQRATYKGLVICGNVWGCPVCSARVSRVRRDEMNTALAWAKANGLFPVMLTLTTRHGRDDTLEDLLEGIKKAKQGLRQRKIWRDLGVEGSVTATEITNGLSAGWHPHFHEILFMNAKDEAEAIARVKRIHSAWISCLRRQGLDGAAAALQVQGAAQAGTYITKWGAAEEMTLGDEKKGKKKGRSMLQLLELAGDDDRSAMALWLEYFRATSGKRRRQLVWSSGLKDRVGINDVSDEDAAAAEVDDDEEPKPVAEWSENNDWRKARPQLVSMMEAVESGGGAAAVRDAERGPTDHEIYCDDPILIDDEVDHAELSDQGSFDRLDDLLLGLPGYEGCHAALNGTETAREPPGLVT